jgi:hypothetical protein
MIVSDVILFDSTVMLCFVVRWLHCRSKVAQNLISAGITKVQLSDSNQSGMVSVGWSVSWVH